MNFIKFFNKNYVKNKIYLISLINAICKLVFTFSKNCKLYIKKYINFHLYQIHY